ncbi:hypothetical protein GCM10010449_19600 [Streptomyces rectiviolaceus]|uniref:Uncharacterized protein n=1 Tax=Streptomyces rectiviolaceus TaxID=332591 RepID=A0ABP6MCM0_9ACTN
MVGVVEEEHQVAETDERVGSLARAGEILCVAVHVTDHIDPETWHADHPRTSGQTWVEAPRSMEKGADLRLLPSREWRGVLCGSDHNDV